VTDQAGPGTGHEEGEPRETAAHPAGAAPDDISGLDDLVEEGTPLGPDDRAEVDPLAQQLAERTADLQRLQAEYVNYKRRVDRDRDLVRENATFGVLSAMLPVLDDIDRAREHGEVEGGFKAVAESLERIVSGLGLTKYGAPGDPFDPNLHEALMHGHSAEVTTTSVEHVAQAGYRIGERVVRAAKVTVLDPE
jgi:molecular chaperone GrpE